MTTFCVETLNCFVSVSRTRVSVTTLPCSFSLGLSHHRSSASPPPPPPPHLPPSPMYIIQFSSKSYLCARKSPYALHPPCLMFPQSCVWNGSNVRLIDDGHLTSYQGRSSSPSSFHASLLQAIDGVMSLALCPQVVSQATPHFLQIFREASSLRGLTLVCTRLSNNSHCPGLTNKDNSQCP